MARNHIKNFIIVAALLGAGFGYTGYRLNAVAWWLAVIAWILAALFGLTSLTALVNPSEPSQKAESPSLRRDRIPDYSSRRRAEHIISEYAGG